VRPVRRVVDGWQRRHAAIAFPVAVARKFADDRASVHAALIAHYAFLSLFPLLLMLVSILGLVLEDRPGLQQDVLDTALARIPVIGDQLEADVHSLEGSGVGIGVGLAGALWAGLGVTVALGRAFDDVWDVPRVRQPGALRARARGMAALGVTAAALVAATVLPGLALGGGIGPVAQKLAALAAALALNALVFFAVFALLTGPPRDHRRLLPGVAVAAAGSLALQSAGGWYVDRAVVDASEVYGGFALVIGLLSWFWLGSHLLLIAAEVNVVLDRGLWPRSVAGPLEPADRFALRSAAEAVQRDERQHIAVRFDDEPEGSAVGIGGSAPAGRHQQEERDEQAQHADGHEDDADGLQVDPGQLGRDGEVQDRAGRDTEE
jgi:membrane protein